MNRICFQSSVALSFFVNCAKEMKFLSMVYKPSSGGGGEGIHPHIPSHFLSLNRYLSGQHLWKVSEFLIIGSRSNGVFKFQTRLRKTGSETSGKYRISQWVEALKFHFACRYIEKSLLYHVRSKNLKKYVSGLARTRISPKNLLKNRLLGFPISCSRSTASWKNESYIIRRRI
jgi:hypothetical protein